LHAKVKEDRRRETERKGQEEIGGKIETGEGREGGGEGERERERECARACVCE
jgi:hypothetical protein